MSIFFKNKFIFVIYKVPIYSIDSFLSLWLTESGALYLNMLRDCYEAYVLYLFLSLMLSFLNCDEDDYDLSTYLETVRVRIMTPCSNDLIV